MKLLEKIMLATDFSPAAQQAFRVTLNLAGAFHSEIILLHVLPEIEDYSQTLDFLKREAARELEAMQEQIKQRGIETSNVITTPGDPSEQITRHAEDLNVNLVILGAGEKEAGDRVQLGITAERVIRDSHKPVWVVRQGGAADIDRVLCPVDFSDSSQRALYTAIHLCRQFRSTLTVLTVVPSLSSLGRGMGSVADKEQKGLEKNVQSRFEEFLSQFDFHNVSWQKRVSQGKPHREIISAVADGRFDLIIMGTAGRRGLAKFLIGSVTEKVIRELPSSIITVKSEHAIRLQMEAEIEDIQGHLKRGRDLLEKGFPREAVDEFEACIEKDMMFAPAWEALADAQQRLGNERSARDSREKARMIRESLWTKQVVADARKEVLGKKV